MKYFLTADKIDRSMGGKAYGLAQLMSYGVNVPTFVILPFLVAEELLEIRKTETNEEIKQKIESFQFPSDFIQETKSLFNTYFLDKVAVRSSCSDEDGDKKSFAGQYKTMLNVTSDTVFDAIKTVWMSAFDTKGKNLYFSHNERGKMSVVIQSQIDADKAGVCFSTSPLNKKNILIEYVDGQGELLVSGKSTPKKYEAPKLEHTEGFLEVVRKVAVATEEKFGCAVDLEWCLKDGKVYFVQLRKVTAKYTSIKLPRGKWNLYVRRNFPWLIHSVQVEASKSNVQKNLFGFAIPIYEGVLVDGKEFYTEQNDLKVNELWAKMNVNSIQQFCLDIEKNCSMVCEYTQRLINSQNCIESKQDYIVKLNEFFSIYINSYIPMMMRPEEFLSAELARRGVDEVDIANIGYLDGETMTLEEKRDFLDMAMRYNRKDNIEKVMSEYLSRYSWMKSPTGYHFCEYTQKDILARMSKTNEKECENKLEQIKNNYSKAMAQYKKVLNKLVGETRELAILLHKFIYLRTRTAELSDRLFFVGRKKILALLEEEIGHDYLYLGFCELVEYVERGSIPSNLEVRKKGDYTVWMDGLAVTNFGHAPKEIADIAFADTNIYSPSLKGDVACPGRVVGKIRVVRDYADAKNMRKGEILVATMTTTDLTDAIAKAEGFITDEGGISCHAAIIARELNVPCVVGTRVATQVLSTGMMVELNAFDGSITILDSAEENN